MAEDYCESEGEVEVCKNFFVQQVMAMMQLPSPELLVKDVEQPRCGSLRRLEDTERQRQWGTRDKAEEVLKCKGLKNEELLPVASSPIALCQVSQSSLLMKRQARRFST